MKDALRQSIQALENKIRQQLQEVKDTKNAINVLYGQLGEEPPYELLDEQEQQNQGRPDRYFGKTFTGSVRHYLDGIKKPATVGEIVKELRAGGYDFGQRGDPTKSVAISLGKNTLAFIPIPNSDAFGLREWYGETKRYLRRQAKEKTEENNLNGEDLTESNSKSGENDRDENEKE